MPTDTNSDTNTEIETAILTLTQWFSPAYPVGGFAYSHGLEWAIDSGAVTDADNTAAWIETVLQHGTGWNDALFLAAAYSAAPADLPKLDTTARAFAASAERLKETDLQGAAFCQITSALWSQDLQGLTYPIAVGRAAQLEMLPLVLTTQIFLQAFLANLAAVAMRLVPLGQTDGQRLIRDLTPLCADIAARATSADLNDLSSTAFLGDIASMKHETQYSRIFRT